MTRSFTTANWNTPPFLRQSFQQVQSLFPTARIRRNPAGGSAFATRPIDLMDIEVFVGSGAVRPVRDVLADNNTDAFLVVRDGVIITEDYRNGMRQDSVHLINSITKSYAGMLAGILVGDGVLDTGRLVSDYLPGFSETAFAGSTVQHLLDMTAAPYFNENYASPDADFWHEASTVGWCPHLRAADSPASLFEYALGRTEQAHVDGTAFEYRTLLTNVLAMVIEAAGGQPVTELLETRVWQPLGCENDASLVVDPTGFAYMGAGLSASARDLARFGDMLCNNGRANGTQIVPADWIESTLRGSDLLRAQFAAGAYADTSPGGHYHNQVWANDGLGILVCSGIHGQLILVERATKTVVVALSTHDIPQDQAKINDLNFCAFSVASSVELPV
ncbi:MAG: serine hydrolase [Actinomycetota bacterium]